MPFFQRINAEIRKTAKNMRALALVMPLASVSGGNAFLLITKAVSSFIKVIHHSYTGFGSCGVCVASLSTAID